MSRLLSIQMLFRVAVLLAAVTLSSPASAQHGHGGGHGGGHGYGGHYGGGHGNGFHGGLHGYSHDGYGHQGYGHDYGHRYSGHDYGVHGYGHGGSLHGYGHHDYYPHSLYNHYPHYYDDYPYYYWYPSFSVSHYPWYGFYGLDGYVGDVIASRRVVPDDDARREPPSTSSENTVAVPKPTATAQGSEYQRRATSAFREGRYDEAVRSANHALIEMPRNGKLLLFVSHALFATGDYRGAAAAIHQAATLLDKGDWGYAVKNWRNYYRGMAYTEAMRKLDEYVKKNPDAAYAHFLRGYHFGFLGNEEYARTELAKAIQLESRDRLAVELLKTFGGKPQPDATEAADVNRTISPNSNRGETEGDAAHDHDH